jgi:hypothetical protein
MLKHDVIEGLTQRQECAVSLYLPLSPEQRDIRQQSAELRDAMGEVEQKLEQHGLDPRQREAVLTPLRERLPGLDLATHREPCLAIFMCAGLLQILPLPEALPRSITVGHHFNIKPLLPLLARNRRFWLLALSERRARLFNVTPFGSEEMTLDLTPPAPGAAMPPADFGTDDTEARDGEPDSFLEDLAGLTRAVETRIGSDSAPILLAAEPRIGGHFRKTADLPNLLEDSLILNPHAFHPAELQRRALEVMRPDLETPIEDLVEQIQARLGDAASNVAIRLEEILAAAEEGRVDSLLAAEDEALWGQFEPGRALVAHGRPSGQDEDLLNRAAVATLRNGGRAYAVPRARIPRASPAAATLRY